MERPNQTAICGTLKFSDCLTVHGSKTDSALGKLNLLLFGNGQ